MLSNLQYFTTNYISFQENLTEQEKGTLIKWVKEATNDQIKSLLITGDCEYHQEAVKIFNEFNLDRTISGAFGRQSGQQQGLAAAVIAAAAITLAYKSYKRFFSKAAKACSHYSGNQKTNCMTKYKKQAMTSQVSFLKKGMSQCSKSKDPTKCKQKIQTKINSIKGKLGAL